MRVQALEFDVDAMEQCKSELAATLSEVQANVTSRERALEELRQEFSSYRLQAETDLEDAERRMEVKSYLIHPIRFICYNCVRCGRFYLVLYALWSLHLVKVSSNNTLPCNLVDHCDVLLCSTMFCSGASHVYDRGACDARR